MSRYIRLDGTGWHAGRVKSLFQTAASKATAGWLAANSLYTAFHVATTPQADPMLAGMVFVMGNVLTLANAMNQAGSDANLLSFTRSGRYPIDTQGRALPPENLPDLLSEISGLKDVLEKKGFPSVLKMTGAGSAFTAIIWGFEGSLLPSPTALVPLGPLVPQLARTLSLHRRFKKLLDDTYRFAGTPPRVTQEERARVAQGALNPV